MNLFNNLPSNMDYSEILELWGKYWEPDVDDEFDVKYEIRKKEALQSHCFMFPDSIFGLLMKDLKKREVFL